MTPQHVQVQWKLVLQSNRIHCMMGSVCKEIRTTQLILLTLILDCARFSDSHLYVETDLKASLQNNPYSSMMANTNQTDKIDYLILLAILFPIAVHTMCTTTLLPEHLQLSSARCLGWYDQEVCWSTLLMTASS